MGQHLKYRDRVTIEYEIAENPDSTLLSTSEKLKVSRSTIVREIARNSAVSPSKGMSYSKDPAVALRAAPKCPLLSRWPYCCNRCGNTRCAKARRFYRADEAERMSKSTAAKAAREPSKLTLRRAAIVEAAVSPLIKRGISIEAALVATSCDVHPTTVRRWIDENLISPDRTDLPRAAGFYCKKLYDYSRKRSSAPARIVYGRTIDDYRERMAEGGHRAVQADTVIGKQTDRHCVLTVMDPPAKLQIGVRIRKTAAAVNAAILAIHAAFCECGCPFDTVLTDNGPEMQRLPEIETNENGVALFKVYYCDPYNSSQKADCERNHEFPRYGLKKGESVEDWSDDQITELFSKVNSYPRKSLGWSTPFQTFRKKHKNGAKLIRILKMREIPLADIDFKKK